MARTLSNPVSGCVERLRPCFISAETPLPFTFMAPR